VGTVSGFYIVESQYVTADGTSTSMYPCYIVGQNALAISQPESMSMTSQILDGNNWTILHADTTYGVCRADWLRDTSSGRLTTNIVAQTGAAFDDTVATVNAFNNSSALLWVYGSGTTVA
jgi:hypothetical protein